MELFSFFSVTGWGIDLDYCDIEWFALETNRDHCVVFETASKYCMSDSFVDHDGYSISSKGFLPTVVYIIKIKQKQYPVVDVTGDRSKVRCCKEQYYIGTWNVTSMNQGKLEVVKQEMARVNVNILGN